jgi:hypothetical protein
MFNGTRDFLFSGSVLRQTSRREIGFHHGGLFLGTLALVATLSAAAAENFPAAVVIPFATVSALETTALNDYAAGAAALRQRAVSQGLIDYQDVIATAYAPGVIDEKTLLAKAHWRAAHSEKFPFISDYARLTAHAAVRTLVAVPDPKLHSTLVAQYESTSNVIGVSVAATDFAIFHEAGHALQRAALRAYGAAAGRRDHGSEGMVDPELVAGTSDITNAYRLRYLCSQDEFEVRLQDLNRFHALLVAGRPIMDAADSVRALAALGLPLDYDDAQAAFAAGGQELSRTQFDNYIAVPPATGVGIAAAFEDARELFLLRRFALRVDHQCWQRMLAKIIFEAPGHF